jgi:hypothetical protein
MAAAAAKAAAANAKKAQEMLEEYSTWSLLCLCWLPDIVTRRQHTVSTRQLDHRLDYLTWIDSLLHTLRHSVMSFLERWRPASPRFSSPMPTPTLSRRALQLEGASAHWCVRTRTRRHECVDRTETTGVMRLLVVSMALGQDRHTVACPSCVRPAT